MMIDVLATIKVGDVPLTLFGKLYHNLCRKTTVFAVQNTTTGEKYHNSPLQTWKSLL